MIARAVARVAAKSSKPNQNISPKTVLSRSLIEFALPRKPVFANAIFFPASAASSRREEEAQANGAYTSIGIVVDVVVVDVVATIAEGNSHPTSGRHWDETLVELFAFTSAVSWMHRAGDEREKESLVMTVK